MLRKTISALALSLLAVAAVAVDAGTEPTEIGWKDLVAGDWQPQQQLDAFIAERGNPSRQEIYEEMARISAQAPIEPSMNGKLVKMPGFVLPIEHAGTKVKEFLLLPYHGACIHVPAPPPNQVVYAKTGEDGAFEVKGMFAPVWVTGRLHTERVESDLAEAGYTMEVSGVEPYEFEQPGVTGGSGGN